MEMRSGYAHLLMWYSLFGIRFDCIKICRGIWVDKKRKENSRSNHKIEDVSIIYKKSFDYIVIAVLAISISQSIKSELVACGIQDEKIALMQSTNMKMDDLEKIFSE